MDEEKYQEEKPVTSDDDDDDYNNNNKKKKKKKSSAVLLMLCTGTSGSPLPLYGAFSACGYSKRTPAIGTAVNASRKPPTWGDPPVWG